MDTNEIITNEEVIEVTEEVADVCSNNGIMVAAGIGLAVLVGGLAYKYAVKPIVAKIKAKKKQAEENPEDYVEVFDNDEKEESAEEPVNKEND